VNNLLRLLSVFLPLFFTLTGSCQAAPPSTFGTTVGYTLLCLNSLNEIYFRQYLTQAFGQPYKREEGAYWFKSNAKLWGIQVTDILVSDETSDYTFLAAVLDSKPEKLNDAIANVAGIRHTTIGTDAFPIRQAQAGSQIIHFQQKSKIFCSKSRYLVPN
jgi:hypothetical protein